MTERKPEPEGVAAAAKRVAPHVVRTPLLPLDWRGVRLWVKAECLQEGGSFKLRGATNRLLLLDEAARARGVVAFSSGNHAQGVAIAARRLGIAATIVMPADAPAVKRESTLAAGAQIVAYDRAGESREAIAAALAEAPSTTVTGVVPSFVDLLALGLGLSKSDARRAVRDGGAYLNNRKVTQESAVPEEGDWLQGRFLVLRRGRKAMAVVERVRG